MTFSDDARLITAAILMVQAREINKGPSRPTGAELAWCSMLNLEDTGRGFVFAGNNPESQEARDLLLIRQLAHRL